MVVVVGGGTSVNRFSAAQLARAQVRPRAAFWSSGTRSGLLPADSEERSPRSVSLALLGSTANEIERGERSSESVVGTGLEPHGLSSGPARPPARA